MADAPPGTAGGGSVTARGGMILAAESAAPGAAGLPAPEIPMCAKCGGEARRPRDCEHTGWAVFCTECYVELHYYLTEPGAEGS